MSILVIEHCNYSHSRARFATASPMVVDYIIAPRGRSSGCHHLLTFVLRPRLMCGAESAPPPDAPRARPNCKLYLGIHGSGYRGCMPVWRVIHSYGGGRSIE